ncbi:MAG: glycosyltransferase [Gemmatimonadota bacterium]
MQRGGILIVSASTGTGHARAAEALRDALATSAPDTRVESIDLLDLAPGWVRTTYGGGYELMATRAPWLWQHVYHRTDGNGADHAAWSPLARRFLFGRFRELLRSAPWQLCLCTHFLPCQLAAGQPGLPPFALAITDFTLHRFWVQRAVRQYFVATETLASELRERVRRAAVEATGIPIASAFAAAPSRPDAKERLGLDPRKPVALVMGGGLGGGITEMVGGCVAGAPEEVQVVAVCGRNSAAPAQLRALDAPEGRLRIFGYVTGIQDLIAAADLVVTKPGGLTCSEALALGRPLLLTRPIPGQETGNTRVLVSAGAAVAAPSGRDMAEAMTRLFAGDGLLSGLAAAARRIGRPDAADRVAELIRERIDIEDLSLAS